MTEQAASEPSVALLGTGIMGAGMARTVLLAGTPLRVWNRAHNGLAGGGRRGHPAAAHFASFDGTPLD